MDLSWITAEVNGLVTQVGEFILSERQRFQQNSVESKGLNQLVSYVDIEAEKQLVAGLKQLIPDSGFITEENTTDNELKEYNWIIDPLDGTTNFIHHVPVFSISVALVKGNDILIGVVYELGRKDLFTSRKGGGAWLNGKPIHVSDCSQLSKSLLATGFPYYEFEQLNEYIELLKQFMKSCHGLRRMGSAAVDLAYVASGKFEGFFEIGLNAWDVAAGVLLVKEAGGEVKDFNGGEDYLFGKHIIASNSLVHKEFSEVIYTCFKP